MSEQGSGSVLTGNPAGGQDATAAADGGQQGFDWQGALGKQYQAFEPTLQAKGWKSPADVLTGYTHLEKLLGADKAGRGLVLPKDDDPPEAWAPVFDKLGRPATPEDYKLPVPEGADPGFAKAAAGEFHKLGLTAKQATALSEWWNGQATAIQEQQAQRVQQDFAALAREWGPQLDANRHAMRAAAQHYGLAEEQVAGLEASLGVGPTAKLLLRLAQENKLVGDGLVGGGKSGFGQTSQQAQAELDSLRADPEFSRSLSDRSHPRHAENVKRLNELSERARPNAVTSLGGLAPAPV